MLLVSALIILFQFSTTICIVQDLEKHFDTKSNSPYIPLYLKRYDENILLINLEILEILST